MEDHLILQVKNLNKSYEKFSLKNINIELGKGSIMGFIGPNGAGKSTTIKSILGLIPFDSGQIRIIGMDNAKDELKVKQYIGYVSEQSNLYSDVSAFNIYKFVKKLYTNWDEDFFNKIVKQFGLDLNKKIKQFSRGMTMKYSMALALSHHPKLLILDEPTSGLDPVVRSEVLDILFDIADKEKSSIFFSSHITEDIVKIADRVTYIYDGKILLSDTKSNILNKSKVEDKTAALDDVLLSVVREGTIHD